MFPVWLVLISGAVDIKQAVESNNVFYIVAYTADRSDYEHNINFNNNGRMECTDNGEKVSE